MNINKSLLKAKNAPAQTAHSPCALTLHATCLIALCFAAATEMATPQSSQAQIPPAGLDAHCPEVASNPLNYTNYISQPPTGKPAPAELEVRGSGLKAKQFGIISKKHLSVKKPAASPAGDSPEPAAAQPAGQPPSLRLVPAPDYQAPPNIAVGVPFAYGLSWGRAGIGLGWQERTRYTKQPDGGLGMGIGLGNPDKSVGFDVGVSILDVSDFARRGSLSFKIHRTLSDDLAVAVGVQNAIVWGYTDAGSSAYAAVTQTFRLQETAGKPFSSLTVSAGIGGGQFRSESDIKNSIDSVGVFGSVALRVAEPVSAIAEWTGQDLTLGLSCVPFRNTPLTVTGALTDLTGTAGDGSRFLLRVGYQFSF